MKILIALAVLFVSSTAVADRQTMQDALKKMEGFTDDMCRCKDAACAQRVTDAMTKWGEEMAKRAGKTAGDKVDPADANKMAQVAERLTKCMTTAMTAPAPQKGGIDTGGLPAPKPGTELNELGKQMNGTWRCTGKLADLVKPNEMLDIKATVTSKLARELDDTWIQTTVSIPVGKLTIKSVTFTTYNATDAKWYRHRVDNMRGSELTTSAGLRDGKFVWEGESLGGTKIKVRHTDDFSDPKSVKVKSELSADGKTWSTAFEASCKK